ncbi:hypothetical protein DFQ28_010517 [Apophysomyces sp. BC1034]|nr:hypothetical protein DFQ30_010032 [Apophysomyces sp. BC1015]KAG0171110.1 hypothetical protein DFQ29_008984 [Apophysomyces sp. BC1021]KAG0184776.1 hypothetical protein DFQ28_010517 [Apophysomyces sp. BC1034]
MADLKQKIVKQVEFYFSDSNLPFDKYLWNLTQQNKDGFVPISTIASFKKMRMISTDLNLIIEAIKSSDLLEVDEANEKLRRKTPVEEQNITGRSIYAKEFPKVDEETTDHQEAGEKILQLQDKIVEFFEQHGKVLSIRMRKTDDRPSKFKGSVFVEFADAETAEKVAAMSLEYEGTPLTMQTKPAYFAMKAEQYKNQPSKGGKRSFNAFREQRKLGKNKWKSQRKSNPRNTSDEAKSNETEPVVGEKRALEEADTTSEPAEQKQKTE